MKITDKRIIEAIKAGKELYRRSLGIHTKYHIRERRTGLEAYVRYANTNYTQTINIGWLEIDDWEVVGSETV